MARDEPSLASQLLLAQEAERRRIAKELHSDIGQQIAALTLIASKLKRRIASVSDELAAEIDPIHFKLGEIARGLQGLSRQLYPALLEHAGIVAALDSDCTAVSIAKNIQIEFTAEGQFDNLTSDEAMCLYRVAEGALKNIAMPVSVSLRVVNDGIELRVSGLVADGLEIAIIRERAQLAGAEAQIQNGPDGGVRFTLPARPRT